MQFEDLQVIWNSQENQAFYGVDEEGLHNLLRKKSLRFRRLIFRQHLQTYGSATVMLIAVAGMLALNASGVLERLDSCRPLFGWEIIALLVALACWAQFAVSVYLGGRRQKVREQLESSSLRDDLDKEIEQIKYQINTRSRIMLGFIPPYLGSGLWIAIVFGVTGISAWALIPIVVVLVVALVFESRCQQRMVELKIVPALSELETLREKLSAPNEK